MIQGCFGLPPPCPSSALALPYFPMTNLPYQPSSSLPPTGSFPHQLRYILVGSIILILLFFLYQIISKVYVSFWLVYVMLQVFSLPPYCLWMSLFTPTSTNGMTPPPLLLLLPQFHSGSSRSQMQDKHPGDQQTRLCSQPTTLCLFLCSIKGY